MPVYAVNFDPATIAKINAMILAAPMMEAYYKGVMRVCVNKIATDTQVNAPVLTGTLRRGVRGIAESAWLGRVGILANVVYAPRREFGFDNQKDRLGRYFPQDPKADTISSDGALARSHMFYLKRAMQANIPFVMNAFKTSTQLVLRDIARTV